MSGSRDENSTVRVGPVVKGGRKTESEHCSCGAVERF